MFPLVKHDFIIINNIKGVAIGEMALWREAWHRAARKQLIWLHLARTQTGSAQAVTLRKRCELFEDEEKEARRSLI
ncbi:unnamed protein product [Dracunculus medinensis]|uniref:Uncharacterized protein n=1 Tax=Dracunculus medinensis TaxID=318479 RepID=A0A0N4U6P6_DRAME|nr:unnamed protein product [Dracunculus medinensis]